MRDLEKQAKFYLKTKDEFVLLSGVLTSQWKPGDQFDKTETQSGWGWV